MQTTFNKFMQNVEQTTDILETQTPRDNFPPKQDILKAQEVTEILYEEIKELFKRSTYRELTNVGEG